MEITLTLAELKEYCRTWHESNFSFLHQQHIIQIIDMHLANTKLLQKINSITDVQSSVISAIKVLSKSINGKSSLTDSSTLSEAINELNNKNVTLSSINLKDISDKISRYGTSINTLNENKADKETIEQRFQEIEDAQGIIPKQIQAQNMPVNGIGDNLNDYKTPGLYVNTSSGTSNTLKNRPLDTAFTLVVLPNMENSVKQILIGGNNTSAGEKIYIRNYQHSGDGWENWYELYGEHNTTPLQMQVDWSDGGSTTYKLLQVN